MLAPIGGTNIRGRGDVGGRDRHDTRRMIHSVGKNWKMTQDFPASAQNVRWHLRAVQWKAFLATLKWEEVSRERDAEILPTPLQATNIVNHSGDHQEGQR